MSYIYFDSASLFILFQTAVIGDNVVSVAQAVAGATEDLQNTTTDDIEEAANSLKNIVGVESDDPEVQLLYFTKKFQFHHSQCAK